MVMMKHVIQCNSAAHWWVFNSFDGSEQEEISGCDTHNTVGLGLNMGFVDKNKNREYYQTYPLIKIVVESGENQPACGASV